mmetsp:Transcript_19426/g.33438  ORF Transcript_19426/g.33438 Transcript_19426/m.33438 type:complete len:88 (-) Transcript_19426:27-290(-)
MEENPRKASNRNHGLMDKLNLNSNMRRYIQQIIWDHLIISSNILKNSNPIADSSSNSNNHTIKDIHIVGPAETTKGQIQGIEGIQEI